MNFVDFLEFNFGELNLVWRACRFRGTSLSHFWGERGLFFLALGLAERLRLRLVLKGLEWNLVGFGCLRGDVNDLHHAFLEWYRLPVDRLGSAVLEGVLFAGEGRLRFGVAGGGLLLRNSE